MSGEFYRTLLRLRQKFLSIVIEFGVIVFANFVKIMLSYLKSQVPNCLLKNTMGWLVNKQYPLKKKCSFFTTAQHVSNNYEYGSDPITVTCFNCKNVVVTRTTESTNALCCFLYVPTYTTYKNTLFYHNIEFNLSNRFGCWALICSGCQDVEHRCPQCNVILGLYKAS